MGVLVFLMKGLPSEVKWGNGEAGQGLGNKAFVRTLPSLYVVFFVLVLFLDQGNHFMDPHPLSLCNHKPPTNKYVFHVSQICLTHINVCFLCE